MDIPPQVHLPQQIHLSSQVMSPTVDNTIQDAEERRIKRVREGTIELASANSDANGNLTYLEALALSFGALRPMPRMQRSGSGQ